mmetsp:Transcript_10289/g.22852  ORF Transcript_10289/g.22852 Transcript_10289/m.22852 type:complete len:327 (-) Transcript_10289:709-1689(-)
MAAIHRTLHQGQTFLMGVLRNLTGSVISNVRVKCRHKHQGSMQKFINALLIGLNSIHAVICKRCTSISNEPCTVQQVAGHHWLENIELKVALCPPKRNSCIISNNLSTNHCQSLTLCRVDFTRHDRRSWLIFRKGNFSKTAAGTTSKEANVIGYLVERAGNCVQNPTRLHKRVMSCKCFKLVFSCDKRETRLFSDYSGDGGIISLHGIETGAHSGSTECKAIEGRQRTFNTTDSIPELTRISTELLSEGEGRRILTVCPPNLNNVRKFLRFRLKGNFQLFKSRKCDFNECLGTCDVHGCGKGVIRALAHITMVVRMHRGFASHLST